MEQKKRVIALGFFDGVHNGHAALMRRTAQVAREIGISQAQVSRLEKAALSRIKAQICSQ